MAIYGNDQCHVLFSLNQSNTIKNDGVAFLTATYSWMSIVSIVVFYLVSIEHLNENPRMCCGAGSKIPILTYKDAFECWIVGSCFLWLFIRYGKCFWVSE